MSPLCPKPSKYFKFLSKSQILLDTGFESLPIWPGSSAALTNSLASFLLTYSSLPGLMALLWSQETYFCFVFLGFLLLFKFPLKWSLIISFQMAASIPTMIITPIFCIICFLALSYFGRPYICFFLTYHQKVNSIRTGGLDAVFTIITPMPRELLGTHQRRVLLLSILKWIYRKYTSHCLLIA